MNVTSDTAHKKTPPQTGQYTNTSEETQWYPASLSRHHALCLVQITETEETLNQHVNLGDKNKSFLGGGSTMPLCRSGVLS